MESTTTERDRTLHRSLESGARYRVLEVGRSRRKHIHVKYRQGDLVYYWPVARDGSTYGQYYRILYGPGIKSAVRTS